ncbi:Dps family protein [Parvularcula maris]|uniref:DNA starvation/stationary phase protection protein n=1 Tax=Parvularcula maris TaxID=2965077 RepID=A0A9X2RHX9_9PROT|nr:DNA starvation/stationary phase protection protein [Parvularcula maris]MCQ8185369.1 DNA starvation/stationary phase protection protein [Parvularcula maris]
MIALTAAAVLALSSSIALQDGAAPLEQEVVSTSSGALQATLYDLIALKHAVHQEHWNITGSDFYQLHEFYGELYTALDAPIDEVAERLRALGQPADGRPAAVAQKSGVSAPPADTRAQEETLRALAAAYDGVRTRLYERIGNTGGDMPTQDLLIGTAFMLDKQAWMVRSHLQ